MKFSILARRPVHAVLAVAIVSSLLVPPALAGPPLVCSRFETGGAPSLPWGTESWRDSDPSYDTSRLVEDTLALLGTDTPVIARMETLRRAAIYAREDSATARRLLGALTERVEVSRADGTPDAVVMFDAGFLTLAYDQASWFLKIGNWWNGRDGYALMVEALERTDGDPTMQFAAALATLHGSAENHDASRRHLAAAVEGAGEGSLLARNIVLQAERLPVDAERAGSIEEIREQLASR